MCEAVLVLLATALLVGTYSIFLMIKIEKYHIELEKTIEHLLRKIELLYGKNERYSP